MIRATTISLVFPPLSSDVINPLDEVSDLGWNPLTHLVTSEESAIAGPPFPQGGEG